MTNDEGSSLARRNMRHAILSACWGAIPQVMVKDSSVFIVFAALIGAGEMASVMTTALSDLSTCLLMLPFAALSDRVGIKAQITGAVLASVVALGVACAAPRVGGGPALVASLAVFAVAMSAYGAAWFPMLEQIVPPSKRGRFFGRLRFSWQLVSTGFIAVSGVFLARFASIGRVQAVVILAALASLGRIYHVSRVVLPRRQAVPLSFRAALADAWSNKALTGFGAYLFFLYLAANLTAPVAFVFARNHLGLPDGLVVLLSAVAMAGLIAGFPLGGVVVHRRGTKGMLLCAHLGFAALNFALLAIHRTTPHAAWWLGAVLATYSVLFAAASIAVSSELLALAPPSNRAVSIALGFSLYAAGTGGSRLLGSLLLGSGALSASWRCGMVELSRYHTLFLAAGLGTLLALMLLAQVPGMVRQVGRLPSV